MAKDSNIYTTPERYEGSGTVPFSTESPTNWPPPKNSNFDEEALRYLTWTGRLNDPAVICPLQVVRSLRALDRLDAKLKAGRHPGDRDPLPVWQLRPDGKCYRMAIPSAVYRSVLGHLIHAQGNRVTFSGSSANITNPTHRETVALLRRLGIAISTSSDPKSTDGFAYQMHTSVRLDPPPFDAEIGSLAAIAGRLVMENKRTRTHVLKERARKAIEKIITESEFAIAYCSDRDEEAVTPGVQRPEGDRQQQDVEGAGE